MILSYILGIIFIDPLRSIYFYSPGIGWGGKQNGQICAEVTGVRSSFWEGEGEDECTALVSKRFDGYIYITASSIRLLLAIIAFVELYVLARRVCYFTIRSLLYNKKSKDIDKW